MLQIITLFTINSIFEIECQQPLSPMAKMVYINTLTHHFMTKEANHSNLKGFDVEKSVMKNYSQIEKYYKEMQQAGIAIISNEYITFPDVWSRHIDKKQLTRQSPEEIIATLTPLKPIKSFEEELMDLKGQGEIFNLVAMKNGISVMQAKELLPIFIYEQHTMKKEYPSIGQVIWHFVHWSRKDYNQKKQSTTKPKGNRIIGME